MLSKLIKVIKNIPHGEFKINKNYKSITNSKLNKVGFRNEQELETFIFNQLVYLGYEPKRQLRFTSNNELERNSIPDIIVEKGNVVFIIELKLHAAHIADLYQLDRYINNKMLLKKFPNKQIIGMLLTGHFDESILNEVRNNLSSLNLYSYTYSNEKINIELNYGNENIKLFDN